MISKVGSHVFPECVVCLVYRWQAFINTKHCSPIQWMIILFLNLDHYGPEGRCGGGGRDWEPNFLRSRLATNLQIKEATVNTVRAFLNHLPRCCPYSAGKQLHTQPNKACPKERKPELQVPLTGQLGRKERKR